MKENIDLPALAEAALLARQHAYAPYSGMTVGAALLTARGDIVTGCNIENAAFSPSLCAERVAFAAAIAAGERDFAAIAIAGGPQGQQRGLPPFYPCGVCRQMMAEFCDEDFLVVVARSGDDFDCRRLGELLPHGFSL